MVSKSSLYVLLAFTVLGLVVSGLLGALFPHDYGTPETPFGILASTSPATPALQVADVGQVPHGLQLAPPSPASVPPAQPPQVPPRDVMVAPSVPAAKPVEEPRPAQTTAAVVPAVPAPTSAPTAAPVAVAPPPLPPTVVASNAPVIPLAAVASPVSADTADATPPATTDRGSSAHDAIDINKAPVEVLNHLPGMGMIGKAIVRHRPYRSIQDLVDKRVLRLSAFQKLKSRIKVD